ncbi:hypothetical protein PM076_13185 [Halorubrum ezzemoulense]|uniref:Conditioned medium-induced protein 4 n=1 Tax=Halorubrum ezzemoulense TaxID=337243 RepID=A0ABT4Z502_HALEZ|nr:hypothetical protein [Halorubrum ezzemoulense]MDB2245793.1 hypothetical protein [Halorubrum ezzemoulense]MDB2252941.1 hypothetical protein [Halorubrum ezzemoulense]MDB2279441.1 hypothetical protein [Halorubrum ezzemoulense]MDB2286523.1 hypothetical protein [Halorubrum ezzemoulense]MDB2289790.1 hypothetical protein [Halorubrum ezzemoulense]
MDEKTAELRDLFVDATGSETVTERQEAERGTLVNRDDASEGVRDLVAAMRERYGFSTPLDDAAYALVARGRFADESDAAVAAAIRDELDDREDGDAEVDPDDIDAETVRKARLDLHLVRESDRKVGTDDGADPPFAYADLKRLTAAGNSIVECAEELDAAPDTVARYAAVARTDIASTRANDRFRDAFRDLLTDADIEGSLASDAREDGLREATEDIETDVSL